METRADFDILEMPFEALAAYWLSLKKLTDAKRSKGALAEEIQNTGEPFIRHLLELTFSDLEIPVVRRLAEAKRDTMIHALHQKVELMRLALFAIASGENPRVTLVRMNSKYAFPLEEEQAFKMAMAMTEALEDPGTDRTVLLEVDHKMPPDRLLVKLLFYAIHARKNGRESLEPLLRHAGSPYLCEGMSLCIDGFEADFVAYHLESIRDETLRVVRAKMDMSVEMVLGIRKKHTYDDLYRAAHSFIP